ncbi:MAG: T9SS type A sorting domain-containing protein [Ignavibacteria bacterium]|nr:T9SS type A sorting domain-containing protein [Ignavibacteria bacterium]MBT8383517.1 T9SS type A sorting domain-containing protein [Ignavibacteria bacterium]MBT8390443.1 T9SS type A sorting domain-containing protein [Ignavibacteria bacterium]NNJ51773.1 T9SS type A sorting domain-containing protein [Ignavibacteriaceae bacterium]NNL22109.1 T9SS type A sorting domain-containing protein [Ignavibacteriaceae bacterium]
MKFLLLQSILILIASIYVYPQAWQQTPETPEGAGVTAMVLRESNQHLFVTTASFNWPNGDMGGVRRSTDEGATWENLNDVFVARTIIDGPDGNLYASIWPFPQPEGLYRSTDNGDNWGSPLVTVPTGDNIFSITMNTTTIPNTIFAGTRNGPLRSTDNGVSWAPAIAGIPPNSWVRDIEVDSGGTVAAATTNGVFISTNNGDLWEQATGVTDTIVTLAFDYPFITDNQGNETKLYGGSDNGQLVKAIASDRYLAMTLAAFFDVTNEISDLAVFYLFDQLSEDRKKQVLTLFPRILQGGGYYQSTDNGETWDKQNQGMPSNPQTSAVTGAVLETRQASKFLEFVGMFQNMNGGAGIFKRSTVVSVEKENDLTPVNYQLKQNYPNPFNPSTTINFSIPDASFVLLKVYNSLGQEIETLVAKELNAGNYKYDWNAENSASGIYFYTIQASDFIETKKMILLK